MKYKAVVSRGKIKVVILSFITLVYFNNILNAKTRLPVVKASSEKATIHDGENVRLNWQLNSKIKPDIYYVNIPRNNSKVTLYTDQDKISFKTKFGDSYDFVVLINNKDSCYVRILAKDDPSVLYYHSKESLPDTIPFALNGSRIYFQGILNGQMSVSIQFDLGAGTSCVNKMSSDKIQLNFDGKSMVSNTQGLNEARTSPDNTLSIGNLKWSDVVLTEVGNMKKEEDLIIGNTLFRDKIIEIDYDKKIIVVYEKLPAKAKIFSKQEVFYEQNRPKFKSDIIHNGKTFPFWLLFDTGREGTMLIGEDFTGLNGNWNKLKELQIINGKKIVKVDAVIGGHVFKDIVTNAADPSKPNGRPTLFGNQILNHFNVILDNRKGNIYLKPNGLINESYSDYQSYLKQISK
jgi:hypothetical protein